MLEESKTQKRIERHSVTQEDFTPTEIVDMLLYFIHRDAFEDFNKTIIDIASGDGNILCNVLNRRLDNCATAEDAYRALSTIYGVELMADNVEDCRARLYNIIEARGFVGDATRVKNIIHDNIVCADAIQYQYQYPIKYDYVVQNPPYKRSLHLDFFNRGLDILRAQGQMVIIEPATWLINIRKNGKAKLYDAVKARIRGHVSNIIIENYNREFGTLLPMPFSVTVVDFSQNYNIIKFEAFGDYQEVEDIYDCNLLGKYSTIWSILNKVVKNSTTMIGDRVWTPYLHLTEEQQKYYVDKYIRLIQETNRQDETAPDKQCYVKYGELLLGTGGIFCSCASRVDGCRFKFRHRHKMKRPDGRYIFSSLVKGAYSNVLNFISPTPHVPLRRAITAKTVRAEKLYQSYANHVGENLHGSARELHNFRHFVLNNKLSAFIAIAVTTEQNNNYKQLMPFMADKIYTDDEINAKYGFTEEDIIFIDNVLDKFNAVDENDWIMRYYFAKGTAESLNKYIYKYKNKWA